MAEPICERGNAAPLHPTDTIVAKYQWTIQELKKAIRSNFHYSTRPFFRAAFWVIVVFLCVGGELICLFESFREGAIVAGLGLLWPIWSAAAAPWLAWRQFRQNPNQNAEIEWRLSADDIQIISPQSSTQAKWSAVFKVAEAPDGLLFYFMPQMYHWVPKHGFASEAEFNAAAELAQKELSEFH